MDGYGASDFSHAILKAAVFTGAALFDVRFDHAHLQSADFESALFRSNDRNEDIVSDIKEDDAPIKGFIGVELAKASFRNVILNNYQFRDCKANGAVFDNSDLENVIFQQGSLKGCSFDECYLREAQFESLADEKFSLENASFINSDLSNAKFSKPLLNAAVFTGSNLTKVKFENGNLNATDFSNANLNSVKFHDCDLTTANFDKVNLNKSEFKGVILDRAQFTKASGNGIIFETKHRKNKFSPHAVVFRHHDLSGVFNMEMQGVEVEHGRFTFDSGSDVNWLPGLHCNGVLFNIGGASKMRVDSGLIGNSKIELGEESAFECLSSSIESTALIGLNKNCTLHNTTFDSCNIDSGWEKAKFEKATISQTNMKRAVGPLDKITNKDLEHFDKQSIAALKKKFRINGE